MKLRPLFFGQLFLILPAAALISFSGSAQAASGTWQGVIDATWAGANWSVSPVPGLGETATFDNAGNGNTSINLGGGVTIGNIIFDNTSATLAAYTIGSSGQSLTFNTAASGNAVTLNSNATSNQVINANILHNTADNTMRLVNSSTSALLTVNGTISGGTGATARILNTTGNVTLNGAITAGSAASIAVSNVSSGTLTLGGAGTSNLSTLVSSVAGGKVVVNGQTVTVASSSSYGSVASSFEIQSGSVAFNGGLQVGTSSGQPVGADGQTFKVSGGTFSASAITMGRSTSFSSMQTSAATFSSGFQVTGGAATVTGNVRLAGSNSSAAGLVSGGSLLVNGEYIVGDSSAPNSGRWNLLQVSGGTFTNTNTTNGVVLAKGTARGSNGEFLVTGGTSTVEKISFGISTSATTGASGTSQGALVLNGASGSLYIGSGGIVQGAVSNYISTINLTAGTLGAKADWSSSMNMSLTGSGMIIKAADVSNVGKNITLSGVLSGANGFSKTGGGTLILSNASNSYSGTTTISAGVLRLDNSLAAQNSTVSNGVSNGLAFGTGIITATVAGLSGSGDLALTNTDTNGVILSVGNNNVSSTYTGALSGAGSIAKIGTGTLSLNGNSSAYTAGVALNNGTLSIGNSNGAGTSASTITAVTGTTVFANSTLGGGTVAAAVTLSGTNANVTLTSANASGGYTSAISGDSTQTVTISSAGGATVNMNATTQQFQSFSGTVNILGGAALADRQTNTWVNGGDSTLFNVDGTMSSRNGGGTWALGGLTGAGTLTMGTSGFGGSYLNYTIGARNDANDTFSGVIKDGDTLGNKLVSVTKVGTGIQTFSGANTYTGATVVNSGALAINGDQSAATGAVSVNNALTRLIGTGTVGGDTTINSGAIQSAGGAIANVDQVGKLTFDAAGDANTNLAFTSGSIFEWDLNANKDTDGYDHDSDLGTANTNVGVRGMDFDAVDVSGTLTVDSEDLTGAIFRVVLGSSVVSDAFWQQTQTWTDIIGGGYSLSGTGFNNSLLLVVDTAGGTYNQNALNPGYAFSVSGTTLTWSAVPEPTSALAGLLLTAGLLRRRRRCA